MGNQPEIIKIPIDLILKSPSPTKQRIIDYLAHECVCEHLTFAHSMTSYTRPETMQTEVAFTNCHATFCACKMYKRDNLKYLERLANE